MDTYHHRHVSACDVICTQMCGVCEGVMCVCGVCLCVDRWALVSPLTWYMVLHGGVRGVVGVATGTRGRVQW